MLEHKRLEGASTITQQVAKNILLTSEVKFSRKVREAILAVKPVIFRYKQELDPEGIPQFGLIAEQVERVNPDLVVRDDDGFTYLGDHVSVGTKTAPVWAALGVVSALLRAKVTGVGARIDVAQTDAAAAANWLRIEGFRAYERPQSEVTGNPSDNFERREPGVAGLKDGVRYQVYETSDGYLLFMASEREFWENFCQGIDRGDLFERFPGAQYADHAVGNLELRAELRDIFATRTSAEWVQLGERVNTPIVNVNTPQTIADDPQFQDRFPWLPREVLGAEQLPTPIKFIDERLAVPTKAPTVGQHTGPQIHHPTHVRRFPKPHECPSGPSHSIWRTALATPSGSIFVRMAS